VVWDHSVELLVPQMDDHIFMAGEWRQERRLKQSVTYMLEGVESADKMPGNLQMPALRNYPIVDRSPGNLFCSIHLPFPAEIRGCRLFTIGKSLTFSGADKRQITETEFATIHVFRYAFKDYSSLSLGPELSWPVDSAPQQPFDVNLHLFAEPQTLEILNGMHDGISHVEEAFQDLVRLLPGMDLKISGQGIPEKAGLLTDIGLPTYQQITFAERSAPCESIQGENANCIALHVDNR
jgi:hypothetical protein